MGRRLPDAGKYRTGLFAVIVRPGLCGRRFRRNGARMRRGLLRRAGVRFKYRAAGSGELRRVLSQTCHDIVDVWNLGAAEPPDVGRAGKLLFERAPVFFCGRRLNGDTASSRQRKAKDNSLCPHFQFLRRVHIARGGPGVPDVEGPKAAKQMRPGKAVAGQENVKAVPPIERAEALLHLADLLHRGDQPRRVFGDEF